MRREAADIDEDCDDAADDADPSATGQATFYADGDGFTGDETIEACTPPEGFVEGASEPAECDDGESSVFPGAAEVPRDGVDQDCDGADAQAGGGEDEGEDEGELPPEEPKDEGCGCSARGGAAPLWAPLLVAVVAPRRRPRRPEPPAAC